MTNAQCFTIDAVRLSFIHGWVSKCHQRAGKVLWDFWSAFGFYFISKSIFDFTLRLVWAAYSMRKIRVHLRSLPQVLWYNFHPFQSNKSKIKIPSPKTISLKPQVLKLKQILQFVAEMAHRLLDNVFTGITVMVITVTEKSCESLQRKRWEYRLVFLDSLTVIRFLLQLSRWFTLRLLKFEQF